MLPELGKILPFCRTKRLPSNYSAPTNASPINIANPTTRTMTSVVKRCFVNSVMTETLHGAASSDRPLFTRCELVHYREKLTTLAPLTANSQFREAVSCRACDETDDRTDEAIFLVRRRYPETNQCSNQVKD